LAVVAERVKAYTQAFLEAIRQAGLDNKIKLLSPMLNQTHPNYDHFVSLLGGASFYEQFAGVSMNLYDGRVNIAAGPVKKNNPHFNAARYRQLLNNLGVNSNKPVFAVEAGVSIDGDPLGVRYEDGLIKETIAAAAENNPLQKWVNDANFNMFAVFSYDPEHEENWDIFDDSLAGQTRAYFQGLGRRLGGATAAGGGTPPQFETWLASQTDITPCPDGTGYASDSSLCSARCGSSKTTPVEIALSYGQAKGDKIIQRRRLTRNFALPPALPPRPPLPLDTSLSVNGTIKPLNDTLFIPDLESVFRNLKQAEKQLLPSFFQEPNPSGQTIQSVYPPESETAEINIQYPLCSLNPKIGTTNIQVAGQVTAPTQEGYLSFIARSRFWCGILGNCEPLAVDLNKNDEIVLNFGNPPEVTNVFCQNARGVSTPSIERPARRSVNLDGELMVPACFDAEQTTVEFEVGNQPTTFFPGSIEAANYYFNSWPKDNPSAGGQTSFQSGLINFVRPAAFRFPDINVPQEGNAKTANPHQVSLTAGLEETKNINLGWKALGGIEDAYKAFQCFLTPRELQAGFGMDCKNLTSNLGRCSPHPPAIEACPNNLLTNGDFEAGFSERGRGEISVANGWNPWWLEGGREGYNFIPEYKPEDKSLFGGCRIAHGNFAQKFFTTFATHTAGFFQQVSGVNPGETYTFSIWVQSWSSGNDDPGISSPPGNYRTSVGIDPNGGTDWQASSVIWSEPVIFHDDWVKLEVNATAQSPTITVFTRGEPEFRVKHNDSYWDAACLKTTPGFCG
jgi:hypothetical protein